MSRKNIKLNINTEIRKVFTINNIPIHDGLSYLLILYYGVEPSFIPKELERKVLALNIVTKDYDNGVVKWKMPLFEETETGFEWIEEWMTLFKNVNPKRKGTKSYVLTRMKRFFVNNPSIRKEEVMIATKLYLDTVSEPMYCKLSHKFIYEQDNSSMLLDYVEQIEERTAIKDMYKDDII